MFPLPLLPPPAVLAPHADTRGQLTFTTPGESAYLDLPGHLRHLTGRIITLSQVEQRLQKSLVLQGQNAMDERAKVAKLRRDVVSLQAMCDTRVWILDAYYTWVSGACERVGGWINARRGVGGYLELHRIDGAYLQMFLAELRQMKGEIRAEMRMDRAEIRMDREV